MKLTGIKLATYKCLSYAKVFNYPLTIPEIKHWLTADPKNNQSQEWQKIKKLDRKISTILNSNTRIISRNGYYILGKRKQDSDWLAKQIKLRKQREKFSREKFKIAKQVSKWLKLIPTIEMVAVTGSLAINQANENDDIDLMIVTSPNTLWSTRFFYLCILQFLGVRRQANLNKNTKNYWLKINNKICPNLLIDKHYLDAPKNKHDIYYAHEITQAKLMWDRNATYSKFLNDNQWIANLLPIAWQEKLGSADKFKQNSKIKITNLYMTVSYWLMRVIEPLMRKGQLWYMAAKKTNEVVTEYSAQFYPVNYHYQVLSEYRTHLKSLTN